MTNQTPWWLVVLLGMGIVFVGLGLMVLLCDGLRLVFSRRKEGIAGQAVVPAIAAANQALAPLAIAPELPTGPERARLLAIASAVIAEVEGDEAEGFKIVSLKRRTQA